MRELHWVEAPPSFECTDLTFRPAIFEIQFVSETHVGVGRGTNNHSINHCPGPDCGPFVLRGLGIMRQQLSNLDYYQIPDP